MSNTSQSAVDPLSIVATGQLKNNANKKTGGWMQAMAEAWANTLDAKAADITEFAGRVSAGDDNPSTLVQLTAHTQTMTYLSTATQGTMSTASEGLNSLARKG
jgi:hypothetical protein